MTVDRCLEAAYYHHSMYYSSISLSSLSLFVFCRCEFKGDVPSIYSNFSGVPMRIIGCFMQICLHQITVCFVFSTAFSSPVKCWCCKMPHGSDDARKKFILTTTGNFYGIKPSSSLVGSPELNNFLDDGNEFVLSVSRHNSDLHLSNTVAKNIQSLLKEFPAL